ncbi:MAG: hypothetical protein P1V34_10535, partial [Alphaproteobacteria bacterium]|nr:hypothetical protein [Alphaproteobacteria bacterium]
ACGDVSNECDLVGVSDAIIDAYEGALVRMRAEGDIGPIQRFREITLECLIASITREQKSQT